MEQLIGLKVKSFDKCVGTILSISDNNISVQWERHDIETFVLEHNRDSFLTVYNLQKFEFSFPCIIR